MTELLYNMKCALPSKERCCIVYLSYDIHCKKVKLIKIVWSRLGKGRKEIKKNIKAK